MEKIPLKTFWETVDQRLSAFSLDELRGILRAMAEETAPAQRQAFLDKLKPMSEETAVAIQKSLRQGNLLADIDDFASELKTQMKGAEYWEEEHDEWGEHYDDEESVGPYEDSIEPLTALFDRAEAAFDYGNLRLARTAYRKLFDVLVLGDDYGRGLRANDLANVDAGEARARYLRAVYEIESPARRPKVLFEHMQQARLWSYRPNATLDDMIQISRKPLPDQERFFEDWIAFLRTQSGNDADAWLREAIRLSRGTPGLEELARKEGKKRPRAYLDWFTALEGEGKHREVLVAARDALQALPAKLSIRADVADHLCAAAIKLNDTDSLRAARWEAFVAVPTLVRLLDLWDATPNAERTRLMQQAATQTKNYIAHPPRRRETIDGEGDGMDLESPAWTSSAVLAHAYLLAEEWDAAHALAAREKVLGWSSTESAQGLVAGFFLAMLSGKRPDALPSNLKELWQAVLGYSSGFGYWNEADEKNENRALKRLKQAYAERLETASLSRNEQEKYLAWCLDVATQRVNAIVGEQHRGSYGKAAMLIAACAETLQLRGDGKGAAALLEDTRNRFPRHRAFQSELDAVIPQTKRGRR
jgi:hypothetical protein